MMLMEWEGATEDCAALLAEQERNCEAWILYGELLFRCAIDQTDPEKKDETYLKSKAAFETCKAFLKIPPPDKKEREQMTKNEKSSSETEIDNRDPVVSLRLGAIHYHFAEKSGFNDEKEMMASKENYKSSLLLVETAEAWRNAGVCAFRLAQIAKSRGDAATEDEFYAEALDCLKMSNEKDNTRPKIWAWLCICSVEGGHNNQVVQSYRFIMERAADMEWDVLMELAQRFLRFSDPANAAYEGGPAFVREGLYAMEAQEIATVVLQRPDSNHGEARVVLGQAFMWQGKMAQAFVELRAALPFFDSDELKQSMIIGLARRCAAEIPDDPQAFSLIEEDVGLAKKRREELTNGPLDVTRVAGGA
jgi:tetratricopeptide (TPR) repeat protein